MINQQSVSKTKSVSAPKQRRTRQYFSLQMTRRRYFSSYFLYSTFLAMSRGIWAKQQMASQPMFQLTFDLLEESPSGTEVCNLGMALWKAGHPAMKQYPTDGSVLYQQLVPFLPFLRIEKENGSVFTTSRVDREKLCASSSIATSMSSQKSIQKPVSSPPKCIVFCQIMLFSQDREAVSFGGPDIVRMNFRIRDINDNSPMWTRNPLIIEIPEHSPIGSLFPLPEAIDMDEAPQNTIISYMVPKKYAIPEFEIVISPLATIEWEPRRFSLAMKVVKGNIDRERRSNYSMSLFAVDGGNPALTGSVLIHIHISDINDHPPVLNMEKQSISLAEDFSLHQTIAVFHATDVDSSDEGKLFFQLSSTSGDYSTFALNKTSGELFLKKSLDYESISKHSLTISVSDGKHVTSSVFHVSVENINDNSPEITCQPLVLEDQVGLETNIEEVKQNELSVRENLPAGTFIGSISVKDKDEVSRGDSVLPIKCHITDPNFGLEPLYAASRNQFKLVTLVSLDREKQTLYFPLIICEDNDFPAQTSTLALQVRVLDDNDSIPQFLRNPIMTRIRENEASDTILLQLQATDADTGVNGLFRYSLDPLSQQHFMIDPLNGLIKTKLPLDREVQEFFQITVFAQDGAETGPIYPSAGAESRPQRNVANATILVTIEDENDCPPVFDQPSYSLKVKEGTRRHQIVGQITAKDTDATPPNNIITYHVKKFGSKDPPSSKTGETFDFQVAHDGTILVNTVELDRERVSGYALFIVAEDQGLRPARLSSSVLVQIHVDDVNDNPPEWVFPNEKNHSVNVTFHRPVGYLITHLRAVDPDEGMNAAISFRLIQMKAGGDKLMENYFQLDGESGALYLSRTLNRQDMGTIKLYLEAHDHGLLNSLSASCILEVNIVDEVMTNLHGNSMPLRLVEMDLFIGIILVIVVLVIASILCLILLAVKWRLCLEKGRGCQKKASVAHANGYPASMDLDASLHCLNCESRIPSHRDLASTQVILNGSGLGKPNIRVNGNCSNGTLDNESSPMTQFYSSFSPLVNQSALCNKCEQQIYHHQQQQRISNNLLNTLRRSTMADSREGENVILLETAPLNNQTQGSFPHSTTDDSTPRYASVSRQSKSTTRCDNNNLNDNSSDEILRICRLNTQESNSMSDIRLPLDENNSSKDYLALNDFDHADTPSRRRNARKSANTNSTVCVLDGGDIQQCHCTHYINSTRLPHLPAVNASTFQTSSHHSNRHSNSPLLEVRVSTADVVQPHNKGPVLSLQVPSCKPSCSSASEERCCSCCNTSDQPIVNNLSTRELFTNLLPLNRSSSRDSSNEENYSKLPITFV